MKQSKAKSIGTEVGGPGEQASLRAFVDGHEATSGYIVEGARVGSMPYGDEDAIRRMLLRGGNVVSERGHRRLLVSRLAHRDYEAIRYVTGDLRLEEVEMLLKKFCAVGSSAWKEYMALHIARRVPRKDGGGDYDVVMNPAPAYAPPKEVAANKRKTTEKVKRYSLSQIFTDCYIADKYSLPVKFMRDLQLMAITHPQDAAATVQQALQLKTGPDVKIVVEAGGYARTRQQAAATIRSLAYPKELKDVAITAVIVDKKAFVYGPGDKDEKGWFVEGPTKNMDALMDVHKLVMHGGMHETMFLLSMETQVLGIEMNDGKNYISPTIISHARDDSIDLPLQSDEDSLSMLSQEAAYRKDKLVRNIRPIVDDKGVVATSVQVGPSLLLMNDHVRRTGVALSVAENRVDVGGIPVSHDLWMQRVSGEYEPWVLRDAVVGEYACVLFHNGVEAILSAPFKIFSSNGCGVLSTMNKLVNQGMSGGALVALSDMALLGLHCGATIRNLFASVYTDTMNLDLIDMASKNDEGYSGVASGADSLFSHLRSRGLHKTVIASIRRLSSLEDAAGEHVGTAFQVDSKVYTTCAAQEYSTDDGVLTFVHEGGFASSAIASRHVERAVMREPQLHERVFIVVCKQGEHYLSHETTVRQVGAGGKTFFLQATTGNMCTLAGGVVISVQDGAVLGMFVRDTVARGIGDMFMCVPLGAMSEVASISGNVTLSEVLQKKLPQAHVDTWDVALLNEAFRHPTAAAFGRKGYDALAMMGRALHQRLLFTVLRSESVPFSQWTAYLEAMAEPAALSSVMVDLGLAAYVEARDGLLFDTGGNLADVLFAMLQVASEYETTEVVIDLMVTFGILPPKGGIKGPWGSYGGMMRRASELAFVDVNADGSTRLISPVD